jgi:hypothetical protein
MALVAVAADKGAPGVSTAAVALAAVWPRPVLLAECDPAGGDLVYRLPAHDGSRLDPRRGLLSLAVAARRGLQPHQVWEHAQKLHGGLDVLTGVIGAEQAAGLQLLWGSVGKVLATVPQADVIADCGRLGVDGPHYDLLAQASSIVLVTRATLGEVIRLRDRANAIATAIEKRGRPGTRADIVVVADYRNFKAAIAEVANALEQGKVRARILGGLAYDPRSAEQLSGEWSGKLDKSMLIRTARGIAAHLAEGLPLLPVSAAQARATPNQAVSAYPQPVRSGPSHPSASPADGQPTGASGAQLARQPQSQPVRPEQQRLAAQPDRGLASEPVRASPPRPAPLPGGPSGQRGRHAGPPGASVTGPDRPEREREPQRSLLPAPLPAPPATPSTPPRGPRER